jgi:hypothetical protein
MSYTVGATQVSMQKQGGPSMKGMLPNQPAQFHVIPRLWNCLLADKCCGVLRQTIKQGDALSDY